MAAINLRRSVRSAYETVTVLLANALIRPSVVAALVTGFCVFSLAGHYASGGRTSSSRLDWVGVLERQVFDLRLRIRGTIKPEGLVGIVDIDDRTVNYFGSWPLSRATYEPVLKNAKAHNAKWFGFDVVFSEPEPATIRDTASELRQIAKQQNESALERWIADRANVSVADQTLARAFAEFGNVVQGVTFIERGGALNNLSRSGVAQATQKIADAQLLAQKRADVMVQLPRGRTLASYTELVGTDLLTNHAAISKTTPHYGFFTNMPGVDGVTRTVSMVRIYLPHEAKDAVLVPSLSLELAANALGRGIMAKFDEGGVSEIQLLDLKGTKPPIFIPLDGDGSGRIVLNHYGPEQTFPYFSFLDLYQGKVKGSLPPVLVLGVSAIGANDQRPSPFSETFSGVEYHAAVIDNIATQRFMSRDVFLMLAEFAVLVAMGFVLSRALQRLRASTSALFLIAWILALCLFDFYQLFSKGHWMYLGTLVFQSIVVFLFVTVVKYFHEEKARKTVAHAFAHYLSPEVIAEVVADKSKLALGGEKRELTVFFSDIRKFTTISEKLSPENLTTLLNEYLTPMTEIVMASNGVVDKYIGDAVMAFWGAPIAFENHPEKAFDASVAMLRKLKTLRAHWLQRGLPELHIGIGLNTGEAVVGNMGSRQRFAYTVIGDTVNLASRIESLTKQYGAVLLCSEQTRGRVRFRKNATFRVVDNVRVVGKAEPVRLFEAMLHTALHKRKARMFAAIFAAAFRAYQSGNWKQARLLLNRILKARPHDKAAAVLMERVQHFANNPPEHWNGVWVMNSK